MEVPEASVLKMCYTAASFEAFTAVIFQVEILWVVTPCSVVVRYQRFRGPCCLHLQDEVKWSEVNMDL